MTVFENSGRQSIFMSVSLCSFKKSPTTGYLDNFYITRTPNCCFNKNYLFLLFLCCLFLFCFCLCFLCLLFFLVLFCFVLFIYFAFGYWPSLLASWLLILVIVLHCCV